MKNILILGGDGYIGWPTAMHFSRKGYSVTVVDNYFRRNIANELKIKMLYEVPSLVERAKLWFEETGNEIKVIIGDLTNPILMRSLFTGEGLIFDWSINPLTYTPDTVIHFAEQPSAPYSVMNYETANITISNNLIVTNNLMFAVKDLAPNTHIIKLGTMGEYGTPNIDIEEGWINIKSNGREDTFLFPRQAGSIYHTSKIMDTDLLWYGVRTWNLRVTDLMQGPVYGIETEESLIHPKLKTFFNYDEVFGTVINRFIAQAVINYPLTIYGSGNQSRGYISLQNSIECIYLASLNIPKAGKLDIYNQIMETLSVREIAEIIISSASELGYKVQIQNIKNPRSELEEHYYNPKYSKLIELGISPKLLNKDSIKQMIIEVEKHRKNIRKSFIFNGIKW